MAKDIIINQVAIWRPKLTDGLTVATTPAGAPYRPIGSNVYKKAEDTIYRYAKNYDAKGVGKFCLFVRTFSQDSKKAEKVLDKIAKKVSEEDIRSILSKGDIMDFDYLSYYLEEKEEN